MQVTGTNPTTVRLKVWPATQPSPPAWQTTGTDTFAALQNPGAVGLTTYLSGSVTNAPVVVRLDERDGRARWPDPPAVSGSGTCSRRSGCEGGENYP